MLTQHTQTECSGSDPEAKAVFHRLRDYSSFLVVGETQFVDSAMSAAESVEAFLGKLSTTDSVQEDELGMYLMHMRTELPEQRDVCQGQERKRRVEELNLTPVSLSPWVSAELENVDRSLVS